MITAEHLPLAERAELDQLEGVIEAGLNTFVEVGNALLRIRAAKLYRETHETFEAYCLGRWSLKQSRAYQLMDAAEAITNLKSSTIVELPKNEAQARPLTELPTEQQPEAWQLATETAPEGKMTAAHVERVVEAVKETGSAEAAKARLAVHFTSDSPEWYTPPEILSAVSECMGGIDLDPCSNSHESPNVTAAEHFTQADNGLDREWSGRVYMNPPYGREIVEWIEKLVAEHKAGNVTEAIALVPSRTDTEWFRMLRDFPRCFVHGRLNFSGHENSAPFPSVLVYLGKNAKRFAKVFRDIGDTYVRLG